MKKETHCAKTIKLSKSLYSLLYSRNITMSVMSLVKTVLGMRLYIFNRPTGSSGCPVKPHTAEAACFRMPSFQTVSL